MVDHRPWNRYSHRGTSLAAFELLATPKRTAAIVRMVSAWSALVVLFVSSASTITAQDDDWRKKIDRAQESIAVARYDEAAIIAAEAMNLIGRDNIKDGRLPDTINVLGIAKHLQGRFIEAEELFEKAIATLRTESVSRSKAALASTLYNLAQTQAELQQYDAAERSLTEVEAIRRGSSSADLPAPEDVLSLFAFLYQIKGLQTEAEQCANQAVSLALKHVGISPAQIAIVYNTQGRIFLMSRRYDEAALSFRESLAWATRARGADHPFTARAMFNLAEVHLAQRRTDLAQPLLTKGLRIVDRALGSDSVTSAEGLTQLGHLYTLDRKFALAQQSLDRALTIHEAAFGMTNPRLVPILNRCATVRFLTNRNQEALAYLSRSIEIARGIPWLQPTFATTLRDRAFLETRMGRFDEAKQDYQRAITTVEGLFGPTDERVLATLKYYASMLHKARQPGLKEVNDQIRALQAANRNASRADPNAGRSSSGYRDKSDPRGHQ